jgi:hypothetical protein
MKKVRKRQKCSCLQNVTLHFHQPGKFGKSVSFIRSHYWKYFLEKYPQVLETIAAEKI